jgi:hypothetical protein
LLIDLDGLEFLSAYRVVQLRKGAGHIFWGIFWLIITPGFWLFSAGLLGWPFHILSAVQASRQVEAQRYLPYA